MSEKIIYPPLLPDLEDWPIFKLSEDRLRFIEEISEHTYQLISAESKDLEQVLSKTIYLEKIRIKEDPWKADPPQEIKFWRKLQKRLRASFTSEDKARIQDELLKIIIHRYAEEIVGNFRIKTFKFARKFLTAFFSRLLNTAAERNHRRIYGRKFRLYDKLRVQGPVEKIRKLSSQGTIIVVPSHFSNLDSILIGYALDTIVGLPALSYGAGLNLYNSEIVGYYFNRLGAYRIDRRKKNSIYLQTLKSMSTLSIRRGVHSLFFPGGTRSRSGALENKFKLGLLGTVVEAQRMALQSNLDNKIFIVPLVLGYHSVLEGNYLINQHLSRTGKEKFLSTKEDFGVLSILKFAWRFFSASSNIWLSFGDPLDVAGNIVDEEGRSMDENGHVIELSDYFLGEHGIEANIQREQVYTQHLAKEILNRFKAENIVLSSHLVAFAAFNWLRRNHKNLDIFGIIRLPFEDILFDRAGILKNIDLLKHRIMTMVDRGEIKASPIIAQSPEAILEDGIHQLGVFHAKKPLKINKAGDLISEDFKLLYYYHNRLINFELESALNGLDTKAKIVEHAI